MPRYAIYDPTGFILRVVDVDETHIAIQLQPGEAYVQDDTVSPDDAVDPATGQIIRQQAPVSNIVPPERIPEYVKRRMQAYPPVAVQLDALWHAMREGEIPKATRFFNLILAVKLGHPKVDVADPVIIYEMNPTEE